jgi:hypothetical protein
MEPKQYAIEELLSFSHCPEYYYKYYIDKVPELKIPWKSHYNNCLKFTALKYFSDWAREGIQPSKEALLDLWKQTWNDPMSLNWGSSGYEAKDALEIIGSEALSNVYYYFKNYPNLYPLQTDYGMYWRTGTMCEPFDIITSIDIILMDRYSGNRIFVKLATFELISALQKDPRPHHDYEMSMWKVQVEHEQIPTWLAYLAIDKAEDIALQYVDRNLHDIHNAEDGLSSIAKAIDTGSRWHNWTSRCKSCRYIEHCKR